MRWCNKLRQTLNGFHLRNKHNRREVTAHCKWMHTWEKWNGENNSICSHLLQSAKENWAEGKAEEEERGLRRMMPFSLGRARVAGAQISWGQPKINCLLWWKSKIKASRPLIPLASLHECPYSVGTSGGDRAQSPWWEFLNSQQQPRQKETTDIPPMWNRSCTTPHSLSNSSLFVFSQTFHFPAVLHRRIIQ